MPIPAGHKTNFDTLRQAVIAEDVALMWCWDMKDERFVAVICAVNLPDLEENKAGDRNLAPVAMMLGEEDPYVRFLPPGHPSYPEDKDVTQGMPTVSGPADSLTGKSSEEHRG